MMKGWALLSNTLFSAIVCSTFIPMMRMVLVMVMVTLMIEVVIVSMETMMMLQRRKKVKR